MGSRESARRDAGLSPSPANRCAKFRLTGPLKGRLRLLLLLMLAAAAGELLLLLARQRVTGSQSPKADRQRERRPAAGVHMARSERLAGPRGEQVIRWLASKAAKAVLLPLVSVRSQFEGRRVQLSLTGRDRMPDAVVRGRRISRYDGSSETPPTDDKHSPSPSVLPVSVRRCSCFPCFSCRC